MKCPHCDQEHPEDFQFCPVTGKKLEQLKACSNPDCPNYGKHILPLDSRFCPCCGQTLKNEENSLILSDGFVLPIKFGDDKGTVFNFILVASDDKTCTSPFFISETPLTQGVLNAIIQMEYQKPNGSLCYLSDYPYGEGEYYPVYGVSPIDGKLLIEIISHFLLTRVASTLALHLGATSEEICEQMMGIMRISLPTESQWKYAARGGKNSKDYLYSGSYNLNEVGWWSGNSYSRVHAVKTKKPNTLGIYDMSGNVMELCKKDTNQEEYVVCGGSCMQEEKDCRTDGSIDLKNLHDTKLVGVRLVINLNFNQ